MAGSAWAVPSPQSKYGGSFINAKQEATRDDTTQLSKAATPPEPGLGGVLSPSEPLFWFVGLAAVSFGLIAYSTTVRVGKAEVDLSVGKT